MKKIVYEIKSLDLKILKKVFKCDRELTPTQMRIIGYLNENDVVYQKDLEKVLNLTRATVSGVLQTMEKNNLITRVSNNSDARLKQILLSDSARTIFEENKKKFDNLEKELVKGISDKELEIFVSVVEKMKNNLN